jgi:16S rRNA (adenine1518-N6/adenine1519-N6)-dimethyltransferase
MLQKEVADRLTAKPGDDAYGFLSLAVRLFADAKQMLTLEPGSFFPMPKVRSAVVVLDRAERDLGNGRDVLLSLLSASFRMPRKKLTNNLAGWNGATKEIAIAAVTSAGISPDARAEELSLEEFDRVATEMRAQR